MPNPAIRRPNRLAARTLENLNLGLPGMSELKEVAKTLFEIVLVRDGVKQPCLGSRPLTSNRRLLTLK